MQVQEWKNKKQTALTLKTVRVLLLMSLDGCQGTCVR